MRNLLKTVPFIAAMLVGATSLVACDDKKTDEGADKDKDKEKETKKKEDGEKSSEKDDEEPKKEDKAKEEEKADAKEDTKVAEAKVEEVDVDALLDAAADKSGVLSTEQLGDIDTRAAPVLKTNIDQVPQLKEAEWLDLPGGTLVMANPQGWMKKREGNVGVVASPNNKAAIVVTTVKAKEDVAKALDEVGKAIGVQSVEWKAPKQVAFGSDGLPALVRGGDVTVKSGDKGELLFAIIETGGPEMALVIALRDATATPEDDQVGKGVFLSIRKKA